MSSPTKAPVERRHRKMAANAIFPGWDGDGTLEEPTLGMLRRVAQALADIEATGYARGLADGAERERAAVATDTSRAGR